MYKLSHFRADIRPYDEIRRLFTGLVYATDDNHFTQSQSCNDVGIANRDISDIACWQHAINVHNKPGLH